MSVYSNIRRVVFKFYIAKFPQGLTKISADISALSFLFSLSEIDDVFN